MNQIMNTSFDNFELKRHNQIKIQQMNNPGPLSYKVLTELILI